MDTLENNQSINIGIGATSGHVNAINTVSQGAVDAKNTTTLDFWNSGSNSTVIDMYYPKTLVDVVVRPETIEIKYIRRSKVTYTTVTWIGSGGQQNYQSPDQAIKEIYGSKDGKLTLLKTIIGRVIPPYDVPETLVFDDEIEG